MKKLNHPKTEIKKNRKTSYALLTAAVVMILLIWILYPIFSNWRNSLYVPELPDLSSQPKELVNYLNEMHSAALENPDYDRSIGRLGMTFHANSFYEEAGRCYNRAMNLNEREWRWAYYLALISEELGDTKSSIENLKIVLEINSSIAEAWFRLGNALLKRNQYNEALSSFNKALTMQSSVSYLNQNEKNSNKGAFPLEAFIILNISRTENQVGKHTEALERLTSLIKKYPSFGAAYRLIGQINFMLGENEKAAYYELRAADFESYLPPADPIYDDLIIYSRKTDFIIKQMQLAIRTQNKDWALALNRRIMAYKPESEKNVLALLKLSVDLNDTEGMNTYGAQFVKMFQFNEPKLLEMARFLISRKQYALAMNLIAWVRNMNSSSIGAHLEYVSLLRNDQKYQEAVEYCKNLIKDNPNNPYIKIELARNLMYQRKFHGAATQLSLAEKIDPTNNTVILFRAKLFRAQNNSAKAVKYYKKYLDADPTNITYNLELGNYYIELRQWRTALHHFETILQTSPNLLDYMERYAWILASCPDEKVRNGEKALEFALRVSLMFKFDEEQEYRSAMTLAVAYAQIKDFENALKIANDNLTKLKNNDVEEYYNKFEELQKLFKSNRAYYL